MIPGKILRNVKNQTISIHMCQNAPCMLVKIMMEMKGFKENELLLLKPKLAYAANKPGAKQGIRDLREILSMAVDCVGDSDDKFENFYNFFEAILAYHAAGGK